MKICFVLAPYDGPIAGIWTDVFPPISLLSLASYLRERRPHFKLTVIDGLRLGPAKTLAAILDNDADLFAFSFITFNASTAYRTIDAVKSARPNATVVAGGTHVTSLEMDALEKSKVDILVVGEGEQTFVELADALEGGGDLSRIPGLLFRNGMDIVRTAERPLIENVDTLPFPARDLVDLTKYSGLYLAKYKHNTHILSGRGCVNHCVFCARRVWKRQTPTLRLRSPENIIEEVRELRDRYGIREFMDMGDEFNSSEEHSVRVATALADAKLDMPWQAFSRANPVTDDMARAMADAGCWLVHMGIESGNQHTLDGIRKNITLEQAREAGAVYHRHGIKVVGLFMLFHAWEENGLLTFEGVKDAKQTITFARSMLSDGLLDSITCSPAMCYPGSILYDIAIRHNLIPAERFEDWGTWDHSWGSVMDIPGVSASARWRVKLAGVWTQSWALITLGDLNYSRAIWGRGFGVLKMLLSSLYQSIRHLSAAGRNALESYCRKR